MNTEFRYGKLSKKHKKRFVLHQFVLMLSLIGAVVAAWLINDVELPNNVSKLTVPSSVISSLFLLGFAMTNRISKLFRIRSVGMALLFIMFIGLGAIIDVLIWTSGLLFAVMLIDDIVMTRYWNNIWYNEYDR